VAQKFLFAILLIEVTRASRGLSAIAELLVKIAQDLYDPDVSLNPAYHSGTITRGNKYKLINHIDFIMI